MDLGALKNVEQQSEATAFKSSGAGEMDRSLLLFSCIQCQHCSWKYAKFLFKCGSGATADTLAFPHQTFNYAPDLILGYYEHTIFICFNSTGQRKLYHLHH